MLSTVDPTRIPLFDGDLAAVEAAAARFRRAGTRCTTAGVGVDSRFHGLAGCYRAPERWELLASTARVRTGAVSFGGDLKAVGDALADYAAEMRPVAAALSRLFDQALAFTVEVSGDGTWDRDRTAVATNNSLIAQVSAQAEAKAAVERRCANRIESLVGGRQWHATDRPGDPQFAYGAADIPDNAATPWGTPARWDPPWNHGVLGVVFRYQVAVTAGGVGGTIDGIGVLSGVYGSYAWLGSKVGLVDQATVTAQQAATTHAWRGLALATAAVNPVTRSALHAVAPRLGREADTTVREMVKAMVAWDTWGTDPARAAGLTVFNLGTMLLPGGEASGAIKILKGLRTSSEVGVLSRLHGHADVPQLPEGVTEPPPGARRFAHPTAIPAATRLPDADGPAGRLPDIVDQTSRHLDDPLSTRPSDRTPEPVRASVTHDGATPRLPDDEAPARPRGTATDDTQNHRHAGSDENRPHAEHDQDARGAEDGSRGEDPRHGPGEHGSDPPRREDSDTPRHDQDADSPLTWDDVQGELPTDQSGYRMTPRDCEQLGITPQQVRLWSQRDAPLGMTPEQYRDFKTSLRDALMADGIDPADVDVRLQGSAAHFFSGPHKQFPQPGHPDWGPTTEQVVRDWFGDDPVRPTGRPFDSGKKLGVDRDLSDYDVQISSDPMVEKAWDRWVVKPGTGDFLKKDLGFVHRNTFENSHPELKRWRRLWEKRLGRKVSPVLFPSDGPPRTVEGGISSAFGPHDWIIDLTRNLT